MLIHGLPGSEKNYDIAYVLRDLGWHALAIHLRGSWGSGGDYDILGHVDDARGALDWLLHTDNPYHVDSQRIAVLGYSLGSRAAIVAAARDERVSAVISIAGLADYASEILSDEFLEGASQFLTSMSLDKLARQMASVPEDGNPIDVVADLRCPLLIIHGDADDVVPLKQGQLLIPSAQEAGVTVMPAIMPGADHLFADRRAELVKLVVDWLVETLS